MGAAQKQRLEVPPKYRDLRPRFNVQKGHTPASNISSHFHHFFARLTDFFCLKSCNHESKAAPREGENRPRTYRFVCNAFLLGIFIYSASQALVKSTVEAAASELIQIKLRPGVRHSNCTQANSFLIKNLPVGNPHYRI